jgi:DNA-directed RNA polymerase subunit RPC12/RpoP
VKLASYTSAYACAACFNGTAFSLRYCEETHPTQQPHVNTTTVNDTPAPHLHVTCDECGYEWLMKTRTEIV